MVIWKKKILDCSDDEGMILADSVETLGLVLRTGVKRLGVEEKARRNKCRVRFSLIKKNKAFQKSYMKVGVKKLLRMCVVPARAWRAHAVGIVSTERLNVRRQMAATAGKKESTSLSVFLQAYGLEVEEELSTMATQTWAEGAWIGKWHTEQQEACMDEADFRGSDVEKGERTCGCRSVRDP